MNPGSRGKSADPAEVLQRSRLRAIKMSGEVGVDRTKKVLRAAAADLERRIARTAGLAGGDDSFTATRMHILLGQVKTVTREVGRGVGNVVVDLGQRAAEREAEDLLRYMRDAEKRFVGIAKPLAIDEAAMVDAATSETSGSVLRRLMGDPADPRSVGVLERYGENVVGRFEEQIQTRFVAQTPWSEFRDSLVEESPFLQGAPASWAERIARTEVMAAHNSAGLAVIETADEELGDMVKVLAATFDDRTGADSFAVHGQIRRPSEAFMSWFGSYMAPPNRPNDREVVVPHRIAWPIPPYLKPRSDAEVAARWRKEGRKGGPPGRPTMTTVPLERFGPKDAA